MSSDADQTMSFESLPEPLREVALVDAATAAAVGGMSQSWWREEVRKGRAPKPVLQANRKSRWAIGEVRQFWLKVAAAGTSEGQAKVVVERARRASTAAKSALLQGAAA